jgi:N-methylhydantoinase B
MSFWSAETMTSHDPVTLEVIKNNLDSIADQIALVLMRSAYSPIVRDSLDYSTGVCDRHGRFVAQGLTTALHLGSFPFAMANLMERVGATMKPGDVYIFNDPYGSGGMHLPDIYLVKPVFIDGAVEGFATALVHHADVGGIAPGAMAVYATEIFQEGLRIPLLKLYDGGRLNETVTALIEANVRIPRQVLGDLRAQIAGVNRGEQAMLDLIRKYGVEEFRTYCQLLHEAAETGMRAVIRAIPDGVYDAEDFIDGLGEDPRPIRFRLRMTVSGDDVQLDWTGTSPQVRAAINAPGPFVHSGSYLAFRCLAGPELPNAQGYTLPIKVHAPSGTIVNPTLPAAANARGIVGFRVFDTVMQALGKAIPDRISAGGEGGAINFSVGGVMNGEHYVFGETTMGAWGGRPRLDGVDGAANLAANQSNQPIELIEAQNPLRIEQYGFLEDSGGPGQHRGGLAIVRQYTFLAPASTLTFRSDRRSHLPAGVGKGLAGTPNLNLLLKDGAERELPVLPMEGYEVAHGDGFFQIVPGAGGYGNPLERDPEAVTDDLRDGKITQDYAREVYGVVARNGIADLEQTRRLRASMPEVAANAHLPHWQAAKAARLAFGTSLLVQGAEDER